jgi:hypothetical protein
MIVKARAIASNHNQTVTSGLNIKTTFRSWGMNSQYNCYASSVRD